MYSDITGPLASVQLHTGDSHSSTGSAVLNSFAGSSATSAGTT